MQATSPRRLVVASALTLILVVQGSAQSPTAPATDPRFDRVAEMVQQQMKASGVPGVAIGILAGGAVRTRGKGASTVASIRPSPPNRHDQRGC